MFNAQMRDFGLDQQKLHDFRVLTVECLTAQKMKFSIKDFLTICDQICSLLRIWSHLLKKFLMENFIFCAVSTSLLTSCYDIRSSLTSILCLDNRAKVSQRLQFLLQIMFNPFHAILKHNWIRNFVIKEIKQFFNQVSMTINQSVKKLGQVYIIFATLLKYQLKKKNLRVFNFENKEIACVYLFCHITYIY